MVLCAHEEVILYDALDLKVLNKVVACRSRVVAVSFSRDGKLLATASEQGTVIRIFTVPGAVKVQSSPEAIADYPTSVIIPSRFDGMPTKPCYFPPVCLSNITVDCYAVPLCFAVAHIMCTYGIMNAAAVEFRIRFCFP